MTDEVDKASPVWRWPIDWATSKKFWENVASNIAANLVVAAGGLMLLVFSGLLSNQDSYVIAVRAGSLIVSFIIMIVSLLAFALGLGKGLSPWGGGSPNYYVVFGLLISSVLGLFLMVAVPVSAFGDLGTQLATWLWERGAAHE